MGYPRDVKKHDTEKYHAVWDALDGLVEAWEKLPGGQNHSHRDVEKWLSRHMSPAINRARTVLGRKPPTQ
jgi:hypothetical protein